MTCSSESVVFFFFPTYGMSASAAAVTVLANRWPMFYETARTVQNNWQCSCDFGRNWLIVGASHCVHICLFIWRWAAIAMEIRNSNFPSELDHFNTNCRRGSFLLMQPQLAVNPCRNGCRQWNICKWNVLLEFWTKAHSWAYSWVYRCFPLSAMLGK